jgi:hypothetical protein
LEIRTPGKRKEIARKEQRNKNKKERKTVPCHEMRLPVWRSVHRVHGGRVAINEWALVRLLARFTESKYTEIALPKCELITKHKIEGYLVQGTIKYFSLAAMHRGFAREIFML